MAPSLPERESLCKTVKWHRVPVLSHRWWISVHHAEQAVIIQLTSKSSLKDCSRDVFGHLDWYGISGDDSIHSEFKLLLARAGILFTFPIVLRCSIKLCNGLSSLVAFEERKPNFGL